MDRCGAGGSGSVHSARGWGTEREGAEGRGSPGERARGGRTGFLPIIRERGWSPGDSSAGAGWDGVGVRPGPELLGRRVRLEDGRPGTGVTPARLRVPASPHPARLARGRRSPTLCGPRGETGIRDRGSGRAGPGRTFRRGPPASGREAQRLGCFCFLANSRPDEARGPLRGASAEPPRISDDPARGPEPTPGAAPGLLPPRPPHRGQAIPSLGADGLHLLFPFLFVFIYFHFSTGLLFAPGGRGGAEHSAAPSFPAR